MDQKSYRSDDLVDILTPSKLRLRLAGRKENPKSASDSERSGHLQAEGEPSHVRNSFESIIEAFDEPSLNGGGSPAPIFHPIVIRQDSHSPSPPILTLN